MTNSLTRLNVINFIAHCQNKEKLQQIRITGIFYKLKTPTPIDSVREILRH